MRAFGIGLAMATCCGCLVLPVTDKLETAIEVADSCTIEVLGDGGRRIQGPRMVSRTVFVTYSMSAETSTGGDVQVLLNTYHDTEGTLFQSPIWISAGTAVDSEGREFTCRFSNLRVDRGLMSPWAAVEIPISYLEHKSVEGLEFTLRGQNKDRRLSIPSFYVEGFMNRVRSTQTVFDRG